MRDEISQVAQIEIGKMGWVGNSAEYQKSKCKNKNHRVKLKEKNFFTKDNEGKEEVLAAGRIGAAGGSWRRGCFPQYIPQRREGAKGQREEYLSADKRR